ncbi:MAG: flagellar protein FlaG [Hyphomonadaceae bacterium]|nr:flagellar protein FlaG [Hyphomonadaceae bacterium]
MRIDTAPPLSVSLLQTWPARMDPAPGGPAKKESQGDHHEEARRRREDAAERRAQERPLIAGHLRIELDAEAGRFVQTLTDAQTQEVLRRFPHESQLAFSRAVRAYASAQDRER